MEKSRHRSVASPSYLGRRISICWEEESVSVGKKSQYLLGRRVRICCEEESVSVAKFELLQACGAVQCGAVQVWGSSGVFSNDSNL